MSGKKANKRKQVPVLQHIASTPKAAPVKKRFSEQAKLALLLGVIALIVYANTLGNGFVYDDYSVITGNTFVTRGVASIPEILATPYRKGYFNTSNDLYRPLSLVLFATEYSLWGAKALPFHLITVLLFAGCVALLFLFLDTLFERKRTTVAFIATLLFALHPIHTEVVANIKGCDELLCFLFVFLSMNVFMRYIKEGKMVWLAAGALFFFLSILSKETVFTFVVLIPLIFFFYKNENKSRSIHIAVSAVVVLIIAFIVRSAVLKTYGANDIADVPMIDNALAKTGLPVESRIATAVLMLGYYIRLLFVPYPLICDYSYNSIPYTHFSDPLVLLSLAVYLGIIFLGVWRFLRNRKDPYAFAILFFLVTMALFSNIPFRIGTTMGERLLFFPSLGFCLAAALLIERWGDKSEMANMRILKNPKIRALIIVLSVFYVTITFTRNNDWQDEYTLYSTDVKKSPNSAKLNFLLGSVIESFLVAPEKDTARQNEYRKTAINYLKRSLEIYPYFSDAQTNLGNAYFRISQFDSAEFHEKRAIEINPGEVGAINSLATIYSVQQKYLPAIELYKSAIRFNPNFAGPYTNIAAAYGYLGKYDSAIYYLNKGISIDPKYNVLYEYMAITYKAMGNIDLAKKYEAIARKKNQGFKL